MTNMGGGCVAGVHFRDLPQWEKRILLALIAFCLYISQLAWQQNQKHTPIYKEIKEEA